METEKDRTLEQLKRRDFLKQVGVLLTFFPSSPLLSTFARTTNGVFSTDQDPELTLDRVSSPSISLPNRGASPFISVEEAIAHLPMDQNRSAAGISLRQLSQLLWAGQGITGEDQGIKLRAAPSAGALYPMDLYVAISSGVYHYRPWDHTLRRIAKGDRGSELINAGFAQEHMVTPSAYLVITAEFERSMIKYQRRGVRYSVIEAGNIAENIYLHAPCFGLSALIDGAFDDEKVQNLLRLPKSHRPLLILSLMKKAQKVRGGKRGKRGNADFVPKADSTLTVDRITQKEFPLPEPDLTSAVSIEKAIAHRRSQRKFKSKHITVHQLGQLLWAGQGIIGTQRGIKIRAAPSAGASYPLDLYAVTPGGVYHYQPDNHSIRKMASGDKRIELAIAALAQEFIAAASVNIVITAEPERSTVKFPDKGVRYSVIESGYVSENIYLQAEALGLATVVVGAFYDQQVQYVLSLPKRHRPLLIMPVGYSLSSWR